jgi:hypothetical protein
MRRGHEVCSSSVVRARENHVETPSVDQWSVTDNTPTPRSAAAASAIEVGNTGTTGNTGGRATNFVRHHNIRYGVSTRHRLRQHRQSRRTDVPLRTAPRP